MAKKKSDRTVLGKGKFLRLVRDGKWEIAERINARGVVAVIAVTDDREYVLTEQFRPAVGKLVIDVPAGLSGDVKGQENEALAVSAVRELTEETGFAAKTLKHLADCPSSPGLITRTEEGGGVEGEQIQVQTPKLRTIKKWLAEQVAAGKLIDPKVYAGLYFIGANSKR
jgi:ADP-ribose pyrophosphatase